MKKILIILGIVLLSGCSTLKNPVTEYRIVIDSIEDKSLVDGCREKSLKVAQAFSSSALMSLRMDYAESDNRVFSYSQSQWRESPNRLVTLQILKDIRAMELFKNVQISKSRGKNSWLLETNIEDFMQYYSDDLKESYAKVVISLTLIDSSSNSIVATRTFDSNIKSDTLDAQGGVKALKSALGNVLKQNRDWLNGVCK